MKTETETFLKKTAEGVFQALSQSVAEEAAKVSEEKYILLGLVLAGAILVFGIVIGHIL
jgi:hypothetical protein